MPVTKQKIMALCPDCEEEIRFSSAPKMGQKITCPHCEAYLEVASLQPLELNWEDDIYAEEVYEEGWDADEDW